MRLGDVIEQIRGVSYKPSDLHDNLSDDSVVLLRANNIQDGKIVLDDVVYVSKSKVNESQFLRQGDILVCTSSGSKELVGKAAFIDDDLPMVFGAFCKVVRPNIECCKYMGYFFQSPYYRKHISEASAGANINNLRNEHIADLHFPLPPLEEQRKIAAVLDKVSDLIAKRRTQLDKLDELVKARFVEMFGTLSHPSQKFKYDILKNLCRKITDGKHGGCTPQLGSGRYFVGAREIFDDSVHYETAPEIAIDEFEKDYKRCNLEIGDLLIVNTGATIGKSAIACDCRTQHTLLQKSVALLKVKSELINPVFLKYCYRVNETMYKVESASAQPNLLLSKINTTSIYVPPMALQNQFAAFVEQTEKSKTTISHSLQKLETLKKALMQEYFG